MMAPEARTLEYVLQFTWTSTVNVFGELFSKKYNMQFIGSKNNHEFESDLMNSFGKNWGEIFTIPKYFILTFLK